VHETNFVHYLSVQLLPSNLLDFVPLSFVSFSLHLRHLVAVIRRLVRRKPQRSARHWITTPFALYFCSYSCAAVCSSVCPVL